MPRVGPTELIIILVIILIIFGVGRLGEIGGALGKGIRAFRRGQSGEEEEEETVEDTVNRIMEARKMLPNASYFAFTATPKNKTLEIFGEPYEEGGAVKHRPFHSYKMKHAIQ